jgi:predicted membrane protein
MKKFKSLLVTVLSVACFFLFEILIITYSTIGLTLIAVLIIATLVYGGYLVFKDYVEQKNNRSLRN